MILFLLDINECSISNGGCSHSCHNSAGSFTCSCPSGLELDPGKRSCRGKVKTHRHQVVGVLSNLAFSNSFAGLLEQTTCVATNTYWKKKRNLWLLGKVVWEVAVRYLFSCFILLYYFMIALWHCQCSNRNQRVPSFGMIRIIIINQWSQITWITVQCIYARKRRTFVRGGFIGSFDTVTVTSEWKLRNSVSRNNYVTNCNHGINYASIKVKRHSVIVKTRQDNSITFLHVTVKRITFFLFLDIDECATSKGGCEQGCVNTYQSFYCVCRQGFILAADKKNCQG